MLGYQLFKQSIAIFFGTLRPFVSTTKLGIALYVFCTALVYYISAAMSLGRGVSIFMYFLVGLIGLYLYLKFTRLALLASEQEQICWRLYCRCFFKGLLFNIVAIIPLFLMVAVLGVILLTYNSYTNGFWYTANIFEGRLVALAFASVIIFFAWLVAILRLSPYITAVFLDRKMTFRDSWRATSGANGSLLWLTLLWFFVVVLVQIPLSLFSVLFDIDINFFSGDLPQSAPIGVYTFLVWLFYEASSLFALASEIAVYKHFVMGKEIEEA